MTENIISFPGLGIIIKVSPEAFSIGSLSVKWYGIIISVGIILGFLYCYYRATKTEGIDGDHIYNVTLWTVPLAVVGARAYYVLTTLGSGNYQTFIDYIAVWKGGLAIYGAVIVGFITVLVYCKVCKLKPLKMFDCAALAVMIGQIIGRWGNFVNGECFGWSEGIENLPWRMTVTQNVYSETGSLIHSYTNPHTTYQYVHPTFLYESLWNLLGFLIINFAIYRRKKFDGQVICAYIAWYGLGRGFIEMLRTDSLYVGSIKISVLVAFLSMAAAVIAYIILSAKEKKRMNAVSDYTPKFAGIAMETLPDENPLDSLNESGDAGENFENEDLPQAESGEDAEESEKNDGDTD